MPKKKKKRKKEKKKRESTVLGHPCCCAVIDIDLCCLNLAILVAVTDIDLCCCLCFPILVLTPCSSYHTCYRTHLDQQLGPVFWTFTQHYYLLLICVPLTYFGLPSSIYLLPDSTAFDPCNRRITLSRYHEPATGCTTYGLR